MAAERYRRPCAVSWCTRNAHQRGWCYFHHRCVTADGGSPQELEERFPPARDTRPAEDRFRDWLSKVSKIGDCWIWDGPTDKDGYGVFWAQIDKHRYARAHRYSYFHHRGVHPAGQAVCHTCDTPGCVNPDHLFLGSIADNNADMVAKGRHRHLSGDAHRAAHSPDSFSRGDDWWNDRRRENNKVQRGDNWSTTKLPDSAVVEIRRRWAAREARQKDMAQEYGVSKQLINLICLGKARKSLPVHTAEGRGNTKDGTA